MSVVRSKPLHAARTGVSRSCAFDYRRLAQNDSATALLITYIQGGSKSGATDSWP